MDSQKKVLQIITAIISGVGAILIALFSFVLNNQLKAQSNLEWWRYIISDQLHSTGDTNASYFGYITIGALILMLGFFLFVFAYKNLMARIAGLVAGVITIFYIELLIFNFFFAQSMLVYLNFIAFFDGAFRIVQVYIPLGILGLTALSILFLLAGLFKSMPLVGKIFAALCGAVLGSTVIYDFVILLTSMGDSTAIQTNDLTTYGPPIVGYLLLGVTMFCLIATAGKPTVTKKQASLTQAVPVSTATIETENTPEQQTGSEAKDTVAVKEPVLEQSGEVVEVKPVVEEKL